MLYGHASCLSDLSICLFFFLPCSPAPVDPSLPVSRATHATWYVGANPVSGSWGRDNGFSFFSPSPVIPPFSFTWHAVADPYCTRYPFLLGPAVSVRVFRIRIHWFRIRIQHFRLNTDPDTDPAFTAIKKIWYFFFWIAIYLSLCLHKGCLLSKLQKKHSVLKREHPALQNKKFLNFFLFLWSIFPDPDPLPLTWLNPDTIRIRIRNTAVGYRLVLTINILGF